MIYILIAFMAASAGFIFGVLFVSKLCLIKEKRTYNTSNDNNKTGISRDLPASDNLEPEIPYVNPSDEGDHPRVKQRFHSFSDKSHFWAQFNDDIDGTDHADTLRRMREEEDSDYNYLSTLIDKESKPEAEKRPVI